MELLISKIMNFIWAPLIYLCLGSGVYFSILLRFPQIRGLHLFKTLLFAKNDGPGISSFQAFSLAISGRVGTGNIAGVATAIYYGGPGSIFWMWVIAFLGSASAFTESVLGQLWKTKDGDTFRGGPAYYIEKGLNCKWFAKLFAIFAIISLGILLPGVQGNTITNTLHTSLGLNKVFVATFVAIFIGFIIFGGVKRIAKIAEVIVPVMATGYILLALVIIAVNIQKIPAIFELIITSALNKESAYGGIIGSSIMWGVKRGIFSNEAGQGTGPHPAAAANVSHPAKQGYVQAFSIYIDTLFVCTASAIMILLTNSFNVIGADGTLITENLPGVPVGSSFVQNGLATVFGGIAPFAVALSIFFFAFTTIISYYYIAETNVYYLIKGSSLQKKGVFLLRIVFIVIIFINSLKSSTLAWNLGDIGVGMTAWLNLIAILLLTKPTVTLLKDYDEQLKLGKDPIFDPKKYSFKNCELWEEISQKYRAK